MLENWPAAGAALAPAAGLFAHALDARKAPSDAGPAAQNFRCLLLLFLDELRAPWVGLQVRVRLNRCRGGEDLVDQAVSTDLADADRLRDVLVLAVDRDLAFRRG